MPPAARLYGYKWQQARAGFLKKHPLCECIHCQAGKIRIKPADVVDHITPHKGDMKLFWDRANWQAMNKQCHDSYKKQLELSGTINGCDADGMPVDPSHHWNV
jgi:5-methylcytosine-specific restriction enzyme A